MHIRLRIARHAAKRREGPGKLRPVAFCGSLALHLAAFGFLLMPRLAPEESPDLYHSTIVSLKTDHKIIWYRFKKELPEVSPANPNTEKETRVATEQKARQRIVTDPAADPGKQFVWIPAPQIKLKVDLSAPNLVALQPPPAPPAPVKPALRPFQAPALPEKTAAPTKALPAAPAVPLDESDKNSRITASLISQPIARPQREFTPPPQPAPVPRTPGVEALPAAPAIEPGRGPAAVSVAILGLNPASVPKLPTPDGGRTARIVAGPDASSGPPQLAKGNSPIALPDVSIQGKPGVAAPAATRSLNPSVPELRGLGKPEMPAAEASSFQTTSHVSVPQWPSSRSLPGFVERRFPTRVVYTAVLPSSQNGEDWVVWFAEAAPTPPDTRSLMRPPSLMHAVPLPPVPAKEDHGSGKLLIAGVLKKDGHFGSFTEAPDSGTRELLEALESWQFNPAMRNGVAIDVDAVMEIPMVFVSAANIH